MSPTKPHSQRERSTVAVLLLIGLLIPAGYPFWWFSSTSSTAISDFDTNYQIFTEELNQLSQDVFEPGAGANANRQSLHIVLEKVLTKPITDKERADLASEGQDVLNKMSGTTHSLRSTLDRLDTTLSTLVTLSSTIRRPGDREQAAAQLAHSRKTLSLILTILDALTTMNSQSETILQRIIADDGTLTTDHIKAINTSTTKAEDNFDTLTEAYNTLSKHLTTPAY